MSFYTENGDIEAGGDFDDAGNDGSIVCTNCGSTSFDEDPVSFALVCTSCHTQSQAHSQVMTLEDDIDAIGARAKRGGFIDANRRGGGTWAGNIPDAELDASCTLPDLEACCVGFQSALRSAARRAALLAGLRCKTRGLDAREGGARVMERTVASIWFGYLRAWSEGAEVYGQKFPELRFSMRDAFLDRTIRNMILKHLSASEARYLNREREDSKEGDGVRGGKKRRRREDFKGIENSSGARSRLSPVDLNEDGKNESDHCGSEGGMEGRNDGSDTPFTSNRPFHYRILSMLDSLPSLRQDGAIVIDRHVAALRLKPSPALLASIVHLALLRLRAGTASFHLIRWAASGAFPHAFDSWSCLPRDMRESLRPIRNFFVRSGGPPRPSLLDHHADLLAVACGLGWVRPGARYRGRKGKEDVVWPRAGPRGGTGTVAYRDNVAVMAARMMLDLGFSIGKEGDGFGQKVLDNTLALMGLYELPKEERDNDRKKGSSNIDINQPNGRDGLVRPWLPAALELASPDSLFSPLHVMAVVVVAVRMCRGWENLALAMPDQMTSGTENDSKCFSIDAAIKMAEDSDSSKSSHNGKNDVIYNSLGGARSLLVKKKGWKKGNDDNVACSGLKFIPWNERQLQLVSNGPTLDSYLEFLDKSVFYDEPVLKRYEDIMGTIRELLTGEHAKNELHGSETPVRARKQRRLHSSVEAAVRPYRILIGAPRPGIKPLDELRTSIGRGRRYLDLLRRKPEAVWADANGLGAYVLYPRGGFSKGLRPVHPHYGLLIELCASICDANPDHLHKLVQRLDVEIEKSAHVDWHRECKGRRAVRRWRLRQSRLRGQCTNTVPPIETSNEGLITNFKRPRHPSPLRNDKPGTEMKKYHMATEKNHTHFVSDDSLTRDISVSNDLVIKNTPARKRGALKAAPSRTQMPRVW